MKLAAPVLRAARHRRAGAHARLAGAAGAHDPFRAAASGQAARQGARTRPSGRRGAGQSGGRHSGRGQGGGAQGLHRDGQGGRLRGDRIVDAHQRAQFALGARRRDRDRRRGRRQARRHHAAEGRWALGHPLSRSVAGAARSAPQDQKADPDPRHSGNRAGRQQCGGDRDRLPAHARHEPRPRRSRRLARDEDDARRRRPSGI